MLYRSCQKSPNKTRRGPVTTRAVMMRALVGCHLLQLGQRMSSGCLNRISQPGGLKHRYLLSKFQRLEVQDQGTIRSISGKDSLPGLQTAAFWLCAYSAPSLCT